MMRFDQRMFARLKYLDLMAELYDNAFQAFVQNLMCARHPNFLDTRTAGSLGDMAADGFMLHEDALYAFYAPQVFSYKAVADKFESDLANALTRRKDQFKKFVFVHNDRRGMHPQLTVLLTSASQKYQNLQFAQMGPRHLWHEIIQLDLPQVEDLLHCQIPIESVVYGIGMEDLSPLLTYLNQQRRTSDNPLSAIPEISEYKLDFNALEEDSRRLLRQSMSYTYLVQEYYTKTIDDTEGEEVSAGFSAYYQVIRQEWTDPEDILWQMEMYVLGNQSQAPSVERCAWIILAYFLRDVSYSSSHPQTGDHHRCRSHDSSDEGHYTGSGFADCLGPDLEAARFSRHYRPDLDAFEIMARG